MRRPGRPKHSAIARLPIDSELHDTLLMYVQQQVIKDTIADKLTKAYTILHHTGMRASELLQLNVGMIVDAMEDGKFSLDNSTKTKKTRLIILTKNGVSDLKELFGMEYDDTSDRAEKIFRKNNGSDLTVPAFIQLLNNNIKRALGVLYSSHSYRQSYCTDLLKVAPASQMAKLVGHSNVQTTLRYDYSSENDLLSKLEQVR